MRVISGIYKRRRFDVPRTFKARPTTDFAKENLFNVLNNYIDFEEGVTALDLFAGTGSISIELVSRGCDRVISVEKDPAHHSFICKIMKEVQTDKCLPIRGDVFKFIKNGREQFDFIFADPPYALKELETIPELIFQNDLLKEGGLLVLEHGKDNNFEDNPHFIERSCLLLHISEPTRLLSISYAVFCLKKKKHTIPTHIPCLVICCKTHNDVLETTKKLISERLLDTNLKLTIY